MKKAYYNRPPTGDLPANAPRDAVKAEFARRLQAAMVKKGWNQSELARNAAGYTSDNTFGRDNVSLYIRGQVLPGPVHLAALSRALGMKPDELLPTRGAPSADERVPPLDVRDAGNGRAWLRVNMAVEWSVALEVMKLLKEIPA